MNKKKYFEELEEIVTDSIFVGSSETDLQKEIDTNMWRISISEDIAKQITYYDLIEFLSKVIKNRQDQIDNNTNINHGMFFYLWFDLMASQLRFNLISDVNEKLPFSCKIRILNDPKEIIDDFLGSPFHNGLPIEGYNHETEEKEFELKIYRIHLLKQLT